MTTAWAIVLGFHLVPVFVVWPVLIEPDTGHIPRNYFPRHGFLSQVAAFGAMPGLNLVRRFAP